MAKKKRRKTERKRDLKYGNVVSQGLKKNSVVATSLSSGKVVESSDNAEFKKELRRNLIFVFSFLSALLVIYLVLTKTDFFNPILALLRLKGIYK